MLGQPAGAPRKSLLPMNTQEENEIHQMLADSKHL